MAIRKSANQNNENSEKVNVKDKNCKQLRLQTERHIHVRGDL